MFRFWCQRNCKSFEGVPVPRCFRSVGPLPVSTCYAIHSNVTSILFRDTLNVTYLQTSRDFRRVHAVSAPSCERKNRPNDFSFDASNHANRVLTFKQANCKVVTITNVSAPFDKVFTHKGVKSSKQDDKW